MQKYLMVFFMLLNIKSISSQNCPDNILLKNFGAKSIQLEYDLGNSGWIQNITEDNIIITFQTPITDIKCNGGLPKWGNSDFVGTNQKLKYYSCLANFCDFDTLFLTITQTTPYKQQSCVYYKIKEDDVCNGFILPLTELKSFYVLDEYVINVTFGIGFDGLLVLESSKDGYYFEKNQSVFAKNDKHIKFKNDLSELYFRLLFSDGDVSQIISNKYHIPFFQTVFDEKTLKDFISDKKILIYDFMGIKKKLSDMRDGFYILSFGYKKYRILYEN